MTSLKTTCVLLVLPVAFVAACGKKGDAAPGGAASASTTSATDVPVRDPSGKLTKAGMDAAWKSVFISSKVDEPIAKKQAAFEAKVGAPASVEKGTKVWYAVDGASCYKIELGTDGTKGDEKVDAAKCPH